MAEAEDTAKKHDRFKVGEVYLAEKELVHSIQVQDTAVPPPVSSPKWNRPHVKS